MTSDLDDDALTWDGDSDVEHRTPQKRAAAAETGAAAVPAPVEPVTPVVDDAPDAPSVAEAEAAEDLEEEPGGLSTGMLLALGAIGGIYLLYTVGWLIGGIRLQAGALFLIPSVMYTGTLAIAVAAPALWFVASWLLTRGARSWVRLSVLLVGVVLLVPWPFVMSGGVAA